MGNISVLFGQVIRGLSAGSRVFEYMILEPKISNVGRSPDLSTMKGEIEFKNVSFEYPTRPGQTVLKGLFKILLSRHESYVQSNNKLKRKEEITVYKCRHHHLRSQPDNLVTLFIY